MTWTCGQCPAKVRKADPNPHFVIGTCGWIWDDKQRDDNDECPVTLADMEQIQESYVRHQWGYPCTRLAAAIEARKARPQP